MTACRLAARHGEPAARQVLSGAVELIAGLIEQRGRRRDLDFQRDRPHDEGRAVLDRVVCGDQTGADQAGCRAARAPGFPTGGWLPAEFPTDDVPRPEFAELFGAPELPGGWLPGQPGGGDDAPGLRRVREAGLSGDRRVDPTVGHGGLDHGRGVRVLNVAGNRGSTEPGIGERAERFLVAVFDRLARR